MKHAKHILILHWMYTWTTDNSVQESGFFYSFWFLSVVIRGSTFSGVDIMSLVRKHATLRIFYNRSRLRWTNPTQSKPKVRSEARGGREGGMVISCFVGELNSKSLLCTNQITTFTWKVPSIFFLIKWNN